MSENTSLDGPERDPHNRHARYTLLDPPGVLLGATTTLADEETALDETQFAPPDVEALVSPAPAPGVAPSQGSGWGAARPPVRLRVQVDNNLCDRYAICQQEAPEVFELGADGRLRYEHKPSVAESEAVAQAARCCPMQAITLTVRDNPGRGRR